MLKTVIQSDFFHHLKGYSTHYFHNIEGYCTHIKGYCTHYFHQTEKRVSKEVIILLLKGAIYKGGKKRKDSLYQ